jgi:hypothetical protein
MDKNDGHKLLAELIESCSLTLSGAVEGLSHSGDHILLCLNALEMAHLALVAPEADDNTVLELGKRFANSSQGIQETIAKLKERLSLREEG